MATSKLHTFVSVVSRPASKRKMLNYPFCDESAIVPLAQACGYIDGGNVEYLATLSPQEMPSELALYFSEKGIEAYGEVVVIADNAQCTEYPFGRLVYITDIRYGNTTYPAVFHAPYLNDTQLGPVSKHGAQADARKDWGGDAESFWHYIALILMGQKIALAQSYTGTIRKKLSVDRAYELWRHYYGQQLAIRQGEHRGAVYARSKKFWAEQRETIDARYKVLGIRYTPEAANRYAMSAGLTYEEAVRQVITQRCADLNREVPNFDAILQG